MKKNTQYLMTNIILVIIGFLIICFVAVNSSQSGSTTDSSTQENVVSKE